MKMPRMFVMATAIAALAFSSVAQAHTGKILITAPENVDQRATVDPLKAYGQNPFGHNHTPACAKAFSAFSTLSDMTTADTSCHLKSDHAMIWFPTPLDASGNPVAASVHYYLLNSGYNVIVPPNGLHFVAGNPIYVGAYAPGQNITCLQADGGSVHYNKHVIPTAAQCPHGYEMTISSGQCWNGTQMGPGMGGSDGPADGKSHITSASPSTCTGKSIPRISLVLDVGAAGSGGHLSSDTPIAGMPNTYKYPGSTAHFDYDFDMLYDIDGLPAMNKIVTKCLNVDVYQGDLSCREVDDATTGIGTIYKEKGADMTPGTTGADKTQRVTG